MPVYKTFFVGIITAENESEAVEIAKNNRTRLIHQKTILLEGLKQEDISKEKDNIVTDIDIPFFVEEMVLANEVPEFTQNLIYDTCKLVYRDRNDGSMIVQCDIKSLKKPKRVALICIPPENKDNHSDVEIIECIPPLANFAVSKFLQISVMRK